ncbi:MAG: hypothetical protein A2945_05120 [Candidatus Liptonbacteria bacterium RIFCSPLOWO2_01_FULL_52_25]|uniref:Uncharacterized protein n=1 Tax=Candidatus Liptonbacteria bacterium RIFCSPLOWO2_01_FULL_52_25 TaxID=1798650 RepID=A0A1G2CFX4_9BACT|nr:MAG: hypothetical protein A2945_05120 [Candidatus Liptonbacteria bacterium RIFCSPLOWO2_01_FULL_52_25]
MRQGVEDGGPSDPPPRTLQPDQLDAEISESSIRNHKRQADVCLRELHEDNRETSQEEEGEGGEGIEIINMGRESFNPPKFEREDNSIKNALRDAGLFEVESPKNGTAVYERLLDAAVNYISEIVRDERSGKKSVSAMSSSQSTRRKYHDEMCKMLFGKSRKELSEGEVARVSDFAAHVTGHEEYVGTFERAFKAVA